MGSFIDRMESTRIRVDSPAEVLTCEYSVLGGHVFSEGPEGVDGCADEYLEEEAEALVRSVRVEFGDQMRGRAREPAADSRPDPSGTESWLRQEWIRRFRGAMAQLEVPAVGPADLATVVLYGDSDVQIILRSGPRADPERKRLLADLSAAVDQATTELWSGRMKLRREIDESIRETIKDMKR